MSVTNVQKDPDKLTMTITAEFGAPIGQVWQLWSDPRQLERWWGPPTYPATFLDHDLTPGGRVTYFMTGPEGDQPRGCWRVLAVDVPHRLEFEDGFAGDDGQPDPAMPTMTICVSLEAQAGGATSMAIETTFPSVEVMEQMVSMGMEEGMVSAVGQIDEVLSSAATPR